LLTGNSQIIYEGAKNAEFSVCGIVEGAGTVTTSIQMAKSRFWVELLKVLGAFIGVILAVIIFAYIIDKLKKRNKLRKEKTEHPQKDKNTIIGWIILGVIVIVLLAAVIDSARKKAEENLLQNVPPAISSYKGD